MPSGHDERWHRGPTMAAAELEQPGVTAGADRSVAEEVREPRVEVGPARAERREVDRGRCWSASVRSSMPSTSSPMRAMRSGAAPCSRTSAPTPSAETAQSAMDDQQSIPPRYARVDEVDRRVGSRDRLEGPRHRGWRPPRPVPPCSDTPNAPTSPCPTGGRRPRDGVEPVRGLLPRTARTARPRSPPDPARPARPPRSRPPPPETGRVSASSGRSAPGRTGSAARARGSDLRSGGTHPPGARRRRASARRRRARSSAPPWHGTSRASGRKGGGALVLRPLRRGDAPL